MTIQQIHHLIKAAMQGVYKPEESTPAVQPTPAPSPRQLLPGARCYTDAAISPDTQHSGPVRAGIGIFILQNPSNALASAISIKAAHHNVKSVLEAEARATQLASIVAKTMQLDQITYVSDNQQLVTALQANNIIDQPGNWSIRPILADIKHNNEGKTFEVRKINRMINTTAHNLLVEPDQVTTH
ncbi:hypothetical protein ACP70R_046334 [Stipagrostis hirtigluma subsp. patula]